MGIRTSVFLACFLMLSSALVAVATASEEGEVLVAPGGVYAETSGGMACDGACDVAGTPPSTPWYYWWSSWRWFDRCHDRGQHIAYLPPLPGWYYFRPYSVGQLRAQQTVAMNWGGDPRNPYAAGLPEPRDTQPRPIPIQTPQPEPPPLEPPHEPALQPPSPRQSRANRSPAPSVRTGTATSFGIVAASGEVEVSDSSEPSAIPWPPVLRNPRFSEQRARIEAPYQRASRGQTVPAPADYHNMIDAAEQMKIMLWQTTTEVPEQEAAATERFLDQLATEARGQLDAGVSQASFVPRP